MEQFQLTKDSGRLSYEQRLFYEHNGYLIIRNLISSDILDICINRFEDYALKRIPKGFVTVMRDISNPKLIYKLQDIIQDEIFLKYFGHEELLDIVENFIGPNIMAMHTMFISKPPSHGSSSSIHPPHQDLYYFPFRPANKIVASWTATEKCVKNNGCLYVYPGSHRTNNLLPHGYPNQLVNKMFHGIQDLPKNLKPTDVEMEPGDTVFFHPLLIHGSYRNDTNKTRKAISCHYAASDCEYIQVEGTLQDNLAKEVLSVYKRRFPDLESVSYNQIWKVKACLMRGMQASL